MQKNKLLLFLGKLSEQEIKEFKISYMNKLYDKTSVPNRLLNYLIKYHPSFSSEKLDAEKIHKSVFKNDTYNRNDVINAFSDLRKELKRFLIWNSKEDYPFEKDAILLQLYEKYNLKTHFDLQLKSMNKKVDKESENIWKWYKKMKIAHEYYFDPKKEQINLSEASLLEAMENLDKFYAISKLKYTCELHNRNQVLQNKIPEIKLLRELVNESNAEDSVLHQCFFLSYQLLQKRDENTYSDLKNIVLNNIKTFSRENQHIFLTYLINHHSYRLKNGLLLSRPDFFELYQFGVTYEIFIVDGVFDVSHFNNIVGLACTLKELKWLKEFMKTWSPKLNEDIREQTELMSQVSMLFAGGEFEKIIELTRTIDFKGVNNKLRYRCVQIASSYELDNYSSQDVIDLCTACENFARKNTEIGAYMKIGLLNFTKFVKKLSQFSPQKEKIKAELEKGEFIYFEDWLREKVHLL